MALSMVDLRNNYDKFSNFNVTFKLKLAFPKFKLFNLIPNFFFNDVRLIYVGPNVEKLEAQKRVGVLTENFTT